MSRIALCLGLAAALFFSCPWRAVGEERGGAGEWEEKTRQEDNGGEEELSALEGMELDFSSVEELLGSRKQGEGRFSFEELLKAVFRGDMKEACSMAFHGISDSLFSELSAGAGQMAKILLIALTGAVFTCFSDIFSGGQISETAFYVTFLLLFSLLASSFYESIAVADQAVSQAFELMKALTPGYFMTVAFTGGSLSAGASCGWMLFSITAAQWLLSHLIFPVFRVYVLLVLAGHLTKGSIFQDDRGDTDSGRMEYENSDRSCAGLSSSAGNGASLCRRGEKRFSETDGFHDSRTWAGSLHSFADGVRLWNFN